MTDKESRGRLYQDATFIVNALNGLKVEQLIVCTDAATENPILIYLKVENRSWHQYFLDVGIGFWENWGKDDIADEIENDGYFKYIDSTEKLELKGKQISKIYCKPDFNNSKIIIEFLPKEKLILKCVHPEVLDSVCELIKIKE